MKSKVKEKIASAADTLKEQVKSQDAFGFPIGVRLDGDDMYNTVPGGIASLAMTLLLTWLSYGQTFTMLTFGANTITENESLANYEQIGELNLSDYNNLPMIRMFRNGSGMMLHEYEEMSEYIEVWYFANERFKNGSFDGDGY